MVAPNLVPILFGRPGWVPQGMTIALDFANGRSFGASPASCLAVTAGVNGWQPNSAGIYTKQVVSNTLRLTDLGAWVEEARTNVVLHDRDLTNAAWTKTNITAAKDQTGVDGVANSASSITATAGNGTILQAITLGSSARYQTAFVKRITGTGTVEMTMDNGATYTAVTVTADWTRVSIPTQTLANPTVGFRIVTNGDAIAVDFVQNENGIYPTTPIQTTTGSVTRAADVIVITPSGPLGRIIANPSGTIVYTLGPTSVLAAAIPGTIAPALMGDGAPGFAYFHFGSTTSVTSNAGMAAVSPNITSNVVRPAISWGGAISGSVSGNAVSTGGTGALDAGTWTFGSYNGALNFFNGPIKMVAAAPQQFLGSQLRAVSAYP